MEKESESKSKSLKLVDKSLFLILGAGASVDSGLMTYRGVNGIYNDKITQPEDTLCLEYLEKHPDNFWFLHSDMFNRMKESTRVPRMIS